MAGSLNKVLLIGRLGADPEVKQMVDEKKLEENWELKQPGIK